MDPYQDWLDSISQLQRTGPGRPEERVATAALLRALFHREFVRIRKQFRKNDIEAYVLEDTCYVRLSVEGRAIEVKRLSAQSRLKVQISGIAGVSSQEIDTDIPALSDELCVAQVQAVCAAFLQLVQQDMARRGA